MAIREEKDKQGTEVRTSVRQRLPPYFRMPDAGHGLARYAPDRSVAGSGVTTRYSESEHCGG